MNISIFKKHILVILIAVAGVTSFLVFENLVDKVDAQSASWQPAQGSPLSNKERPRIFFTESSKQDIIQKISSYYLSDYQKFVDTLDADFGTSFSGYANNNLGINAVRNYAFLCQVDPASVGASSSKSRTEYCGESVRLAKEMASALPDYRDSIHCAQIWDGKNCGLFNVSLAVAYDWAYNDMTISDRNSLKGSLEASFDRCNEDCQGERPLIMNVASTAALHGAFPFLALYGDGSSREREMTDWFKKNFLDGMLEVGDILYEGSAYHNEGDSYSLDVVLPVVMMASASSPALGEDLFAKHTYLRGIPDYFYYTIIPQKTPYSDKGGYAGERNNTHRYGQQWMPDEASYITLNALASELDGVDAKQAGFSKWLSDGPGPYALGGPENMKRYDKRQYDLFTKFIWGTRQIDGMDADSAGKSLAQNLGGQIVMRSDHSSESATRVVMHAYDWFYASSHDDTEQGAVGIWKYGPLILDGAGNSKNSANMRRWDTNKGPALNSMMGVFKAGETDKDGYNFMEFDISWPKASVSNDPSQYYEGSQMDRGDKVMSGKPGVYDYINYDYSKMYSSKASSARRQLVYLRGKENSEYVIVYDQVDSPREKRALFHSSVDWQAVGGSWSSAGGGFSKLSGTGTVKIDNSSLPSGNGALFLKVLSPEASVYKIGGSSYPLTDVEGRNISYGGSGDFEYECFSVGCWRIQVRTQNSNLLTAMQIGNASTIGTAMVNTSSVNSGNAEGVYMGDRVVMFAKQSGQSLSSLGYNISTSGAVKHIIVNMEPNKQFDITINGSSISAVSDSSGVLVFDDSGTGSRSISIGGGVAPPADSTPPVVESFSASPTDTQNTTVISWTAVDETALKSVEVWRSPYDATGCNDADKSGCAWGRIYEQQVSGTSHTGSYTDNPPEGTFWYGLHAIDTSSNIGYEPAPVKVVKTVPASNASPTAVASASPDKGQAPLMVRFTGSNSTDSDGTIVSYAWDFGDGNGSSQVNPSYSYSSAGVYQVSLTVTDNDGASDTDTLSITVENQVTEPPANGNALYVDNSFTGQSDGSIDRPFKTIQDGIDAMSQGQTLFIRGDAMGDGRVYGEDIVISKDGTYGNPYVMTAYGNEKVIISSNKTISFGNNNWEIKNLTIDHENAPNDAVRVGGSSVLFDGITLRNGSRDGFEIRSSARDVTIRNSVINDFVWKPGSDAHCIVVNRGAESVRVENSTIYDCGGDGVQLFAQSGDDPSTYTKDVVLSGNTFYTTLGSNSENAIDVKGVVGLTVQDNVIYGFDNKAIVIQKGPQNILIQRNKIFDSDRGIEVRGEGGFYPIGVDIINNLIYDIYGQYALKFDEVENLKAQHNTLVGISGNPFRVEEEGVISGYIQNNITSDSGKNRVLGTNNALVSYNSWFNGAQAGELGGSNEITGNNAFFMDEPNRILDLKPESPVIDKAKQFPHIKDDFEKNDRPVGGAPDMGAYEYASVGTSPNPEVYVTLSVDKNEAYVGDRLTYTLSYNNPSSSSAYNLVIENPIPDRTALDKGSITGNGRYVSESNSVRWDIARLGAGEYGTVSFSVIVKDDTALPAPAPNPSPSPSPNPPSAQPTALECAAPGDRGGVVVISGSDIPAQFIGKPVNSIYGYKYEGGVWYGEPVQVDERRPALSPVIATVYVTPSSLSDTIPENDWVGVDTENGIDNGDYSDEIVFDYLSLGEKAPLSAKNPDGIAGGRYEIRVTDPATGVDKFFYLFQTDKQIGRPDKDFVSYDYKVSDCNGYKSTCEDTTASTACYSTHFSMRWVQDEVRITELAGGDNTDILDRIMGAAYATSPDAPFRASYGENEDHKMNQKIYCGGWSVYDPAHYYLGHIDGPVRAIRQIKGACSFENLIRIWKFSGTEVNETLSMQGHSFGSNSGGFGMRSNYSADAAPLTYYSESFPDGIVFDGVPDFPGVNVAEVPEADHLRGIWSVISSARGGLLTFSKQITPYADPSQSSYWLYFHDDKNFTDNTGRTQGMYGGNGFRLRSFESAESRPILYEITYRPLKANAGNVGAEFGNIMYNPLTLSVKKQ